MHSTAYLARWLGFLLGAFLATQALAASYQVIDLGPTTVADISPEGTVVGALVASGQQAAVLAPTRNSLGFLPEGNMSFANGIHGRQVVGYSSTGRLGLLTHAFLWTPAAGMQDLGTAGDPTLFSAATAVNSSGTIVGYADDPTRQTIRPGVWIKRQLHLLPTLGGPSGFADAINTIGMIVGQSQTVAGDYHATLWLLGLPFDLDTTGGRYSLAQAVNNHDIVVGGASWPHGYRAFRWRPATGMQDLGLLPGDVQSYASGINDAGIIVGTSLPGGAFPPPPAHAVIWVHGQIMDLNTLVEAPEWTLTSAQAINAAGHIVGQGRLNGQDRAFLLVPLDATPQAQAPAAQEDTFAATHQR